MNGSSLKHKVEYTKCLCKLGQPTNNCREGKKFTLGTPTELLNSYKSQHQ